MSDFLNRYSFRLVYIAVLIFYFETQGSTQSPNDFQQKVSYTIHADLTTSNTLDGVVTIDYHNKSNQSIDTIYFHLWMNALSDKSSPFAKQVLKANNRNFYFADESNLGGYTFINAKIYNKSIEIHYKDQWKEIGYIVLPERLKPNESIQVNLEYGLDIPYLYTRMGSDQHVTKLIHWYPRVAVYDSNGWNLMPYLAWGEYYGEVADFNVSFDSHSDDFKVVMPFMSKRNETVHTAKATKVIDYPIVIYPNRNTVVSDTIEHHDIIITAHYYSRHDLWEQATDLAKQIIDFYTEEIGHFPYSEINICQGSINQKSAMEYPGLIVINDIKKLRSLDYYIAHEIAHQYFYGALAFNERTFPFLDEGLATFFEGEYTNSKYGSHYYNSLLPKFIKNKRTSSYPILWLASAHQANRNMDQAMGEYCKNTTPINYGLNSYQRGSQMISLLKHSMGEKKFKNGIQAFYNAYKFQHPTLNNFVDFFEHFNKASLNWIFDATTLSEDLSIQLVNDSILTTAPNFNAPLTIVYKQKKLFKDTTINIYDGKAHLQSNNSSLKLYEIDPYRFYGFQQKNVNQIFTKPRFSMFPIPKDYYKTNIVLTPIIRYTVVDDIMPTLFMHNTSFPTKRLKWLLAPSYSITKRKIRGEAHLSYDLFNRINQPNHFHFFTSYKRFGYDDNHKFGFDLAYQRINFGISYIQTDKNNPQRLIHSTLSVANINEQKAQFQSVDQFNLVNEQFNIIQLKHKISNNTALTPNNLLTTISYVPKYNNDDYFLNLELSYDSKLYYDPKKSFDVRIWASYFILNSKRNSLSYNNGIVKGSSSLSYQSHSDYTYSNYFIDRDNNKINQSMLQGGGFKTVFNLNRNFGQTNDYAASINLTSDLPIKLPKFLPFKLFCDLGIYNQPSIRGNNLKYAYSAGISLSYLNNFIQIHLPVANSKDITNIYKEEGNLFNRISFTIDINQLNFWNRLDHINHFY